MTNERGGSEAAGQGLRVVVVDDDPIARRMVCEELSGTGIAVLGAGAGGQEAIELATELRPDILLMDAVMPDLDGITATMQLAALAPEVKVVILSVASDEELGIVALRAGAVGFLNKELDLGNLPRILSGVHRGEAAFSRHLLRRLVERLQALPGGGIGVRPVRSKLTSREWEILDLLCAGATTARISAELSVSVETVRSHIRNMLRKLGVRSRAEAVALADGLREPGSEQPMLARSAASGQAGGRAA